MNFLKAYLAEKQKEVFALADHFANLCNERVAENMESAENIWGFKFPEKDRDKLLANSTGKIIPYIRIEESYEENYYLVREFYGVTLPYLACCSQTLEEMTCDGLGSYVWGNRDMGPYMSRLRRASWSEAQLFAILDCLSEEAIIAVENEVAKALSTAPQARNPKEIEHPEFWEKMSKYFKECPSPWWDACSAAVDEDNWGGHSSEDACDRGLPRKDTSKGEKRYQSLLKEKSNRTTRQKKGGKKSLSNHKRARKTMNMPTGKSGYKKLNSYIQ